MKKKPMFKYVAGSTTFLMMLSGLNLSTIMTSFADTDDVTATTGSTITTDDSDSKTTIGSTVTTDDSDSKTTTGSTITTDDSVSKTTIGSTVTTDDSDSKATTGSTVTTDDSDSKTTTGSTVTTDNFDSKTTTGVAVSLVSEITTGAALTIDTAPTAQPFNININGKYLNNNKANLFKGIGTVTGNNSSRLLMDYKEKNPDQYWKIMNLLFGEDGANLSLVKIEFGSDINSSSGTEPATMRSENEEADATRGAGFRFAADAKSINPNVKVDLLRWAEPKWVSDAGSLTSEARYEARYKWFKNSIEAAYKTYGYKFDYLSPDCNETSSPDTAWVIWFANKLHNDTTGSYDYSKIKIVASDEYGAIRIADLMANNEELRNAIDVVATHYRAAGTSKSKFINETYNKEIWYSEGSAVSVATKYGKVANASGFTGPNGTLDIMNRIIAAYAWGQMTMYEYQPAVAAYYSGVRYMPKQIITANTPWSGYYEADAGMWTTAHFTQFIKPGWKYVDGAAFCNGIGGAPIISNASSSYLTAADEETGDYSTVIDNDTSQEQKYTVTVSNLNKASSKAYIWETNDDHWLKNIGSIDPKESNGEYTYEITVKPYSMVTLTTTTGQKGYSSGQEIGGKKSNLDINYKDNFEYSDDFLARRGNAPLYTTDQGGAFEVANVNGNKALQQIIKSGTKPNDWYGRFTPNPITCLGDDEWANYEAGIDVSFDSKGSDSNYVGIGTRYNCTELNNNATSGIWIKLYKDGKWELYNSDQKIDSGSALINGDGWTNIKINTAKNIVKAYINNNEVSNVEINGAYATSGRISIMSDYYNNSFDNLTVSAIDGYDTYVQRYDDMDERLTYSDLWTRKVPESFTNYNRTISTASAWKSISHTETTSTEGTLNKFYFYKPSGKVWGANGTNAWSNENGSYYEIKFNGTGINVYGICNKSNGDANIYIDNEFKAKVNTNSSTEVRKSIYNVTGLSNGDHTVKVEVANPSNGYISATDVEIMGENNVPSTLKFDFNGTGFNVVGASSAASIEVSVDGNNMGTFNTPASSPRQATFVTSGLENKAHTASIKLVSGTYTVDAVEILSSVSAGNTGGDSGNKGGNTGGDSGNKGGNTGGDSGNKGGNTGGDSDNKGGNTGSHSDNKGGSTSSHSSNKKRSTSDSSSDSSTTNTATANKATTNTPTTNTAITNIPTTNTNTNTTIIGSWKNINGSWSAVRTDGTPITGWYKDNETWYYLNQTSGVMETRWIKNNNKWYYLNETNGAMETRWIKDSNKWYYLNETDGEMKTGWINDNNKWYYLNETNGEMNTGWINDNGTWYYCNESGAMLFNTTVDGYVLGANGAWIK